MGWISFATVFAAFLLTHSLPLRPAVKPWLVGVFGARGFTVAYSALSLVMLGVLIWAAGQAPQVPLWPQLPWLRHAAQLGMAVVCLIVALGLARPNPFSFGGAQNDRFDPDRPGIVRWLRHPILTALALWAGVHVLPNGDLAHVVLFGTLGGFALAGMGLIDRRKQRRMSPQAWSALRARVARGPILPVPASWRGAVVRLIAGAVVFAILAGLHPLVIGVTALP